MSLFTIWTILSFVFWPLFFAGIAGFAVYRSMTSSSTDFPEHP